MRVLRILIIVLMLLAMPAAGFARPAAVGPADGDSLATIRGIVTHEVPSVKDNQFPVEGCEVLLYYQNNGRLDSLCTTTGSSGKFYFSGLKPQRIGITIYRVGYKARSGAYDIQDGENVFFFTLEDQIEELNEARVTASIPLIRMIQDTTVYNTQAVKVGENDNLQAVLEMLPGFDIKGNSISVDGIPVKRTYVNGTLVFGDRVSSAVELLRADEVRQVKVYDELTDIDKRQGLHNGAKQRVLDIITKDVLLSLSVASAGLAAGTDAELTPRYAVGADAHHHSEMKEAGIRIVANNMNIYNNQTFYGDALGMIKPTIPLTSEASIQSLNSNFLMFWKDRYWGNSLSLTYNLFRKQEQNVSEAITDFFETSDDPARHMIDTILNKNNAVHHNLTSLFRINDDRLKTITLLLNGDIEAAANDRILSSNTLSGNSNSYQINQTSGSKSKDYAAKINLHWANNDATRWRPSISLDGNFSNNNSLSWIIDTLASSYHKRQLNADGMGRSISTAVSGQVDRTLINTKDRTAKLYLSIEADYVVSKSRRLSLDSYLVESPVLDIANSYDLSRNDLSFLFTSHFSLNTKENNQLHAILILKDKVLKEVEQIPDIFTNGRHFPSLEFNTTYSSKSLYISVSGKATTPAIEQLRMRVSDSNPISLVAGNPRLKQDYTFSFETRYRPGTFSYKNKTSGNIDLSLKGDCTLQPIVEKVIYFDDDVILSNWDNYPAKRGSFLNTFDNSRLPRLFLSCAASYKGLVSRNRLKFSVTVGDDYSYSPMWVENELSAVRDNRTYTTLGATLRLNKSLELNNSFSSAYWTSSCQKEIITNRVRIDNRFRAGWIIGKHVRLNANYIFTGYRYIKGTGHNYVSHILNSGIDLLLLDKNALTVGIWGYDLLNSGSTYTTAVTSAYMRQSYTPTYGRCVLLRALYTFRNKK